MTLLLRPRPEGSAARAAGGPAARWVGVGPVAAAWAALVAAARGPADGSPWVLAVVGLAAVGTLLWRRGGAAGAIEGALLGVTAGALFVTPRLSALALLSTLRLEAAGGVGDPSAYREAVLDCMEGQAVAALVGTLGPPLLGAILGGVPWRNRPTLPRISLAVPLHITVFSVWMAVASLVVLPPLVRSAVPMAGVARWDGVVALVLMVGLVVGAPVAAAVWTRRTWRRRAEPASLVLTVGAGPLLAAGALAPTVVLGLAVGIQTVGALVPLRGDAPPEPFDPQMLSSIVQLYSGLLAALPAAYFVWWSLGALLRLRRPQNPAPGSAR